MYCPALVASGLSDRRGDVSGGKSVVFFGEEFLMSRVLSTEQAKAAISQVQSIINGGFTDQISALDAQGRVLSDPNVWDGPLAAQFRGSTWPETKAALDKAKNELEELRGQLQKISQDIFSAGGGA
jgi:hypothetical protein